MIHRHGLIDRIQAINQFDLSAFLPFFIGPKRYGFVRKAFAMELSRWSHVFTVNAHSVRLVDALCSPSSSTAARSQAVSDVAAVLASEGIVSGWRGELYAVGEHFNAPPVLLLERALVPHFGVTAYGVHVNGFVRQSNGQLKMWIAERAKNKTTYPGQWDQMVAGGQPHGLSLVDNMLKECAEEAAIAHAMARTAQAVGAISYIHETVQGLKPDRLFNFDLELPREFVPRNTDGEVARFHLLDIGQVVDAMFEPGRFKFNCELVLIDFFLRHGLIAADHPEYPQLVTALHPSLEIEA